MLSLREDVGGGFYSPEGEKLVARARLENGRGYEGKVYLKFILARDVGKKEQYQKMVDNGAYPDEKANDGIYATVVNVKKELDNVNGDVVLYRGSVE